MAAIRLLTSVPGPKSRAIMARREAASPRHLTRDPRRRLARRGAVVEDVDGNRFIDMAGGIGTMNVAMDHRKSSRQSGNSSNASPTCASPSRRTRATWPSPNGWRSSHRPLPEEDAAGEHRRRGGRERREDRAARHREARRTGVRRRVPRPDAAGPLDDEQGAAVQGGVRPVRPRRAPGSLRLLLPLFARKGPRVVRRGLCGRHRAPLRALRGPALDRGGRRGAGARRRRVRGAPAGLPDALAISAAAMESCSWPTRCRPVSGARAACSRANTRGRARHPGDGEVAGRGAAAERRRRTERVDGFSWSRWPRRNYAGNRWRWPPRTRCSTRSSRRTSSNGRR